MKLIITTYWNKLTNDPAVPFGTRVLPEYKVKSTCSYVNSGWNSRQEWAKDAEKRSRFIGWTDDGGAKFELRQELWDSLVSSSQTGNLAQPPEAPATAIFRP